MIVDDGDFSYIYFNDHDDGIHVTKVLLHGDPIHPRAETIHLLKYTDRIMEVINASENKKED